MGTRKATFQEIILGRGRCRRKAAEEANSSILLGAGRAAMISSFGIGRTGRQAKRAPCIAENEDVSSEEDNGPKNDAISLDETNSIEEEYCDSETELNMVEDMNIDEDVHFEYDPNLGAEIGDSDSDESQNYSDHEGHNDPTENLTSCSKDGTFWKKIKSWNTQGRVPNRNIFTANPGVKPSARRTIDTPLSAWRLLFSERMLNMILKCTVDRGKEFESEFSLSIIELEAFIGLVYMRGRLQWRKVAVHEIYSREIGCSYFNSTIPRDRFFDIMKNLRFDKKPTRSLRIATDPFAPIREIFDEFVSNSIRAYQPQPVMTVDEQLLPSRNRCRFLQYMSNKPDKYGIKFWLLVDNKTKYCFNQRPYLGNENERHDEPLAKFVVKKLVEPIKGNGYHVTGDNFFSSVPLVDYLLQQKITYLGTVRKSSRSLSEAIKNTKLSLKESVFFSSEQKKTLLVKYACKSSCDVHVLSTLHCSPKIEAETRDKKPELVMKYNETKAGVDTLDSMLKLYSTKAATRRWPVCVFYDLLDKAVVNAHVLYKESVGKISRKNFLLQLAKQLCEPLREKNQSKKSILLEKVKRKDHRITCFFSRCENKTYNLCDICQKPFCGKHGLAQKVAQLKCQNCCN